MNLTGVVAMTADGCIGRNNQIPWHHKEDFKYFRKLTLDSTIIMGRKTWDSLPKKPLDKRRNVVITRQTPVRPELPERMMIPYVAPFSESDVYFTDLEHLSGILKALKEPHYVIGGAQIFEALWPYINNFYATMVNDVVVDGDTFISKKFFTEFKLINSVELSPACNACKYVREGWTNAPRH